MSAHFGSNQFKSAHYASAHFGVVEAIVEFIAGAGPWMAAAAGTLWEAHPAGLVWDAECAEWRWDAKPDCD